MPVLGCWAVCPQPQILGGPVVVSVTITGCYYRWGINVGEGVVAWPSTPPLGTPGWALTLRLLWHGPQPPV